MQVALDHLGIAVQDPAPLKKLFGLLGIQGDHIEDVPEQGVKTHFLPLPQTATQIELLEVTDPEGTVAQFIKKRGPGIHHLSFRVSGGQLDSLCTKLRGEGYRLIYDAAKKGAHQMRVNFIHPSTAGGLLIELMEPSSERGRS